MTKIETKYRSHRSLKWDDHGWYWRTDRKPPDAGWRGDGRRPFDSEAEARRAAEKSLEVDCSWCGAEIGAAARGPESGRFENRRGEVFCSETHRSASGRALRRFREEAA